MDKKEEQKAKDFLNEYYGEICPFCGYYGISSTGVVVDHCNKRILDHMECDDCRATWTMVYLFFTATDIKKPEMEEENV